MDEQNRSSNEDPSYKEANRRPQFGNRLLTDPVNVFKHNAWDNVVWDEEQEDEARRKTAEQSSELLTHEQNEKYEKEADVNWDAFYDQHQNRFFKDRHWLFTEFPELLGKLTYDIVLDRHEAYDKALPSEAETCVVGRLADVASSECISSDTISAQKVIDKPVLLSSVDVNSDAVFVTMPSTSRCECDSLALSKAVADVTIEPCSNLVRQSDTEGVSGKYSPQPESELHHVSESNSNNGLPITTHEESSYPGFEATFRILEVGCGVGNTVFPVLQTNTDPGLMVYCCDFSSTAIQIVKEHPDYERSRCHAFVCDVSSPDSHVPFPAQSLDVVILIFVLSAINPAKMQSVIDRLASFLKPGGILLFRDYGRYDMAQLRFKKGRCLSENFYVRGDGTRVYFFTQDELRDMFTSCGLMEKQNSIDRRLQVNRGRQLKMYRVWIQCKYQKPLIQR